MEEPPLQQVITDLFRDFRNDETGGIHAIRGFSFQVWHAVLEALRAHGNGGDYAVVLEWQQDVAVLDSSTAPTRVRFIQLKKNESTLHWTLHSLIASEAPEEGEEVLSQVAVPAGSQDVGAVVEQSTVADVGKKKKGKGPAKRKPVPSILAKLYQHRRRFKDCQSSRLEFVSNASYKYDASEQEEGVVANRLELSTLPEAVRNKVEREIRKQLEIAEDDVFDIKDIGLIQSHGLLDEPHKFAAGELDELMMKGGIGAEGKASMLSVLVIASYINLRAGKKSYARNYSELLARGITRAEVNQYLAATSDRNVPTRDLVEKAIEGLRTELMPFAAIKGMKRELTQACVDIVNRAGPIPLLAAKLKELYTRRNEYEDLVLLREQLEAWYSDFQAEALAAMQGHSKHYIFCLMLMIVENAAPTYELPPSSLDSKPEDTQ